MQTAMANNPSDDRRRDEARRAVEARQRRLPQHASRPQSQEQQHALPAEEDLGGRIRQHETINELSRLAWEVKTIRAYADELVRRVAETMGLGYAKVLELDPTAKYLTLRSAVGFDRRLIGEAKVEWSTKSQAGYTLLSRDPVVVEDFGREYRDFTPASLLVRHGIVSGVTVPIHINGDQPWGVLGAHENRPRCFTGYEQAFLTEAAHCLGRVVERLQDARHHKSFKDGFRFLSDANAALASATGLQNKLRTAARLAIGSLADFAFVDLLEQDGSAHGRIWRSVVETPRDGGEAEEKIARALESHYPVDPTAPHGTPRVLLTGVAERIPKVTPEILKASAADDRALSIYDRLKATSSMTYPLKVGLTSIGTMVFVSRTRSYTEEDERLAEGLARCTALAIGESLPTYPTARELPAALEDLTGAPAEERTRELDSPPAQTPASPHLSPRQLQVLDLIGQGLTDEEVGARLHISSYTARNHRYKLQTAFGVATNERLLKLARDAGLLEGGHPAPRPRL